MRWYPIKGALTRSVCRYCRPQFWEICNLWASVKFSRNVTGYWSIIMFSDKDCDELIVTLYSHSLQLGIWEIPQKASLSSKPVKHVNLRQRGPHFGHRPVLQFDCGLRIIDRDPQDTSASAERNILTAALCSNIFHMTLADRFFVTIHSMHEPEKKFLHYYSYRF